MNALEVIAIIVCIAVFIVIIFALTRVGGVLDDVSRHVVESPEIVSKNPFHLFLQLLN